MLVSYVLITVDFSKDDAIHSHVRKRLLTELLCWGYSVSTDIYDFNKVDLLLLEEDKLSDMPMGEGVVIGIIHENMIASFNLETYPRIGKGHFELQAMVVHTGFSTPTKHLPKWSFSPMCLLHPIEADFKQLVSYIVQTSFHDGTHNFYVGRDKI